MADHQKSEGQKTNPKLRGHPRESEEVRISKTLSWVLRHGSKSVGLHMRSDGYVRVTELLALEKLQSVNWEMLQQIVAADSKNRYKLLSEADTSLDPPSKIWWIRANQGHSIKDVVDSGLTPILSVSEIPTKTAVHGTSIVAWNSIRQEGLNKMNRNHIHLAQGVPGSGVLSGMRQSSEVYIYVDVQKAIDDGVQFFLSSNGVVLTAGNDKGYLLPKYFERPVDRNGDLLDPSIEVPTDGTTTKVKKHGKRQGRKPARQVEEANKPRPPRSQVDEIQAKMDEVVL